MIDGLIWLIGNRGEVSLDFRGARMKKKKLRVETYMYDGNRDLLVVIKNILD